MALTQCIECGKEISTDAKVCPHCGTSKPHKSKMKKTLLIIGGVVLVLGVIGSMSDKSKANTETDLTKASADGEKPLFTEQELKVYSALITEDLYQMVDGKDSLISEKDVISNRPLVVTSNSLQNEYEKNEVAADQKFKDKSVAVRGTVKSLDKTIGDSIMIGLNGGSNMFINPRAEMAKGYENWVASLNKGDSIGLVCNVSGMTMGAVFLNDCLPSYDWASDVANQIISATPEGVKNNNEFFVKIADASKTITAKLKPDSKCFTGGTTEECAEEISKISK